MKMRWVQRVCLWLTILLALGSIVAFHPYFEFVPKSAKISRILLAMLAAFGCVMLAREALDPPAGDDNASTIESSHRWPRFAILLSLGSQLPLLLLSMLILVLGLIPHEFGQKVLVKSLWNYSFGILYSLFVVFAVLAAAKGRLGAARLVLMFSALNLFLAFDRVTFAPILPLMVLNAFAWYRCVECYKALETKGTALPSPGARWLVRWCGFLVLGGMVLLSGCWLADHSWHEHKIARRLESLRMSGAPVHFHELSSVVPEIPPEENLAPRLLGLLKPFSEPERNPSVLFTNRLLADHLLIEWEAPMSNRITSFLAANAELLEQLKGLPMTNRARFDYAFHEGMQMKLPHLYQMGIAQQLLSLDLSSRLLRGDSEGAMLVIKTLLRMSELLATEPLYASVLRSLSTRSLACQGIERLLRQSALTDQQVVELLSDPIFSKPDPDLRSAFHVERCIVVSLLQKGTMVFVENLTSPSTFVKKRDEIRFETFFAKALGLVPRDSLRYLDRMDRFAALSELPFPTRGHEIMKWHGVVAQERMTTNQLSLGWTMASRQADDFLRLLSRSVKVVALVRCTRLALRVEAHRSKEGRFPDSVEDLVQDQEPSLVQDPYSTKALRYRRERDGYLIYSLGPDFRDNRGEKSDPMNPRQILVPGSDIVFAVSRIVVGE